MVAPFDFHLHTYLSDGALSPADLHLAVCRSGVRHWAVTDHDSVAAWRRLRGAPGLIPGAEITAGHHAREVHIVALGIDPDHPELDALLLGIRALRRVRIDALLARLPAHHRPQLAQVDDGRTESLGRLHLARAMVACGAATNVNAAFAHHLGDEHVTDPDLPQFPDVGIVCAAIRAAGGVAILAHPGVYGTFAIIRELLDLGCDGLEVSHPNLDCNLQADLIAHARAHGLLMSAGSDLHFLGRRQPGMCSLAPENAAPLMTRLQLA